jgi:hypothetical protein
MKDKWEISGRTADAASAESARTPLSSCEKLFEAQQAPVHTQNHDKMNVRKLETRPQPQST